MATLLVRSPTSVRELAIRRERTGRRRATLGMITRFKSGNRCKTGLLVRGLCLLPPGGTIAGASDARAGVLRGARPAAHHRIAPKGLPNMSRASSRGAPTGPESAVSFARCGPIADRRPPARTSAWPPPRGSIGRKFCAVQVARRSLIVPWWDRTERAKGQRQPRPNATSGTSPRPRRWTRSSPSISRRFSQKHARRTSVPYRTTSNENYASI